MANNTIAYWERVGNLHIHTLASDGSADHGTVAAAAARAGLDFIIVTDHDVYLPDEQGWRGSVLLLVGEELRARADANGNHYLVLNAQREMLNAAGIPQQLVDAVREAGGLGYIAHPIERSGAFSSELNYDWVEWDVTGYTGIEIWNYMSEFKSYVTNLFTGLLYIFAPKLAIRGPYAATLAAWDEALADRLVWAIGGSDAHAHNYRKGPLQRRVFSYEHLFRAVNTHILVREPWTGDLQHDSRLVYDALADGKAFVAYDALAPAKGFDFNAVYQGHSVTMGDSFDFATAEQDGYIRFEVTVPFPAQLRLICDGLVVAQGQGTQLVHMTRQSGTYRVEAYRRYWFRDRGWIYSNPIQVRAV